METKPMETIRVKSYEDADLLPEIRRLVLEGRYDLASYEAIVAMPPEMRELKFKQFQYQAVKQPCPHGRSDPAYCQIAPCFPPREVKEEERRSEIASEVKRQLAAMLKEQA